MLLTNGGELTLLALLTINKELNSCQYIESLKLMTLGKLQMVGSSGGVLRGG